MSRLSDFMNELRQKTVDDLAKMCEERRAELFALKFQAAVGSLEQTHKIPSIKSDIARIEMLLAERKRQGEVAKFVKVDYEKVVEKAEQAGKEVRKKQRELMEKMAKQGQEQNIPSVSEDAIAQAIENAKDIDSQSAPIEIEAKNNVTEKTSAKSTKVEKTEKPVNKTEEKVEAKKTTAKKASTKTENTTKKPTVTKSSTLKVDKEAKVTTTKKPIVTKSKTETKEIKLEGEVKGTGKGKAALKDIEVKKITAGVAQGHDIEGIDLKLNKKPKDAKTYVFGSNAELAKKQIDEANKKAAAKKSLTKSDDKSEKPAAAKKTESAKKGAKK